MLYDSVGFWHFIEDGHNCNNFGAKPRVCVKFLSPVLFLETNISKWALSSEIWAVREMSPQCQVYFPAFLKYMTSMLLAIMMTPESIIVSEAQDAVMGSGWSAGSLLNTLSPTFSTEATRRGTWFLRGQYCIPQRVNRKYDTKRHD